MPDRDGMDSRENRPEPHADSVARGEAERALVRQAMLLETILSNIPLMIAIFAPNGEVVYVNRAWVTALGWTLESLRVLDPMEAFYPDPSYRAEVGRYIATGGAEWHDWRVRTRDGREVLANWSNVQLPDGRRIGIGQDVTAERAAETERKRLDCQLQQTQKLESLGVLAGGVAHDFNNLLVGILGNASLAEDALPPNSPAAPLVSEMRASAARAADLTRQLLAYAGKGRFVIEPVNLSSLAEEMAALLRSVVSRQATLRSELAREIASVEGDATQLRQIVMNLITNASDALEERAGIITLRTGEMEVDAPFLQGVIGAPDLPSGRYAFVEVHDTGRGMDATTQARIFDPFFTTKFTGRGLGLAAALGIVRSHRGGIRVESVPGAGTTIRVVLPVLGRKRTSGGNRTADPSVGPVRWYGSGDVLLADDEPAVRGVARRGLERLGFSVEECADGREALERFTVDPARWRLVILDLTMPRLAGDAALLAIRGLRSDIPAVLYSGYSEDELDPRLTATGGVRFLQKPFTVGALTNAVRDALGETA